MLKPLLVTALLVLLSTLACTAMSLEDYAEECGEWRDDYGALLGGSLSGSPSDREDAVEDWNALSPPGEVKALHGLVAEALRLGLEATEEYEALEDEMDDLRDELDDAPRSQRDDIRDQIDDLSDAQEDLIDDLRDDMEDLSDDFDDELEDLPRRVERELVAENCI